MAMKQMTFKTKGMNRDLSVSAFNPEFAFENINLRLSTNENNTLLSWVNEKGTLPLTINFVNSETSSRTIQGVPIGTAVINHVLVLFTTSWIYEGTQNQPCDYIYKLWYDDNAKTVMNIVELYHGNLNFSTYHPLETLVSYEAEKIQKVYWVDGRNQPRVINIEGKIKENVDTQFDFVPAINTENLKVTIENKVDTGGTFAPGVIQYAFTYLNKNGQESNIAYVSPLYYLAHESRGESPEGKVANTFVIQIQDADTNFEYVRLYSIQRTSIDAAPFVKRLEDLIIQQGVTLTYIDNGTTGATLDPTELLYVGGKEITALTMIDKDNTLFLGNLREVDNDVQPIQQLIDTARSQGTSLVEFKRTEHTTLPTEGFYAYDNQLDKNSSQITTFKGGEYYRLGFQLQKVTGEWSEPIYIDDIKNQIYPETALQGKVLLAYAEGLSIDSRVLFANSIPNFNSIYKNIRPLIVYPNIADREVLCQGVINPTVFNIEDRVTNSPFSQASWYFRPYAFGASSSSESEQWSPSNEGEQQQDEQEEAQTEDENTAQEQTETVSTIIRSIYYEDYSDQNICTTQAFEDRGLVEYVDVLLVRVHERSLGVISRGNIKVEKTNQTTNQVTTEHLNFRSIPLGKVRRPIGLSLAGDIADSYMYALVSDRGKKWPRGDSSYETVGAEIQIYLQQNFYNNFYRQISAEEASVHVIGAFKNSGYTVTREDSDIQAIATQMSQDLQNVGASDIDVPLSPEIIGLITLKIRTLFTPIVVNYPEVEQHRYTVAIESLPETATSSNTSGFPGYGSSSSSGNSNGYHLYSGMKTTIGTHELFYPGYIDEETGDQTECTFKFVIDASSNYADPFDEIVSENRLYTITFNVVDSASIGQEGSVVSFSPFSYIYSEDNAINDPSGVSYKNVEIQYSENEYGSIYDSRHDDLHSNTQFFIDHSIVTLNSPDLEFDPEVQGYGTEGLGLRIVGVIPITSNASFHKITIGSPMLESWHNYHDGRQLNSAFGQGEKSINVFHAYGDPYAGNRFISDFIWNDVEVVNNPDEDDKIHTNDLHDYLIYPWQKNGSLNNDFRTVDVASSLLKTKVESNILVAANTLYFGSDSRDAADLRDVYCQLHLTENQFVHNIRLKYASQQFSNSINYYPNVDKILYNKDGRGSIVRDGTLNSDGTREEKYLLTGPISMRYKSTTHAAIALNAEYTEEGNRIAILPSANGIGALPSYEEGSHSQFWNVDEETGDTEPATPSSFNMTFWGDSIAFSQNDLNLSLINSDNSISINSFLWLGELYRRNNNEVINSVRFGGKTKEALKANDWFIAGETIPINSGEPLKWTIGDTYYQRYDCLKTYPFSPEDPNQIIEILSFMCETHVNIDGRYDRNRGQIDNTDMSPQNFNLYNTIYSQLNNYFTYKKYNEITNSYPNQLAYTKTKISGADVDLWTNTTLASVLELDGDKGKINSLRRLNNQIIAFQDTGIAQILYNENTQLTTEEGVPVELGNSGKVQGKRYLNNTIGCSNKWSIAQTPSGIYFMDSNDKSIYLFSGEFKNVSGELGFNSWSKQNMPSSEYIWTPDRFKNFVSYYDKMNQEVLFINDTTTLAWNEKLTAFTSFYDYQYTPYFVNLDDTGIWIRNPYTERATEGFTEYPTTLWKHNAGRYCDFFGEIRPYSTTLVGNPDFQLDKIFTNLEFRACVDGEGYKQEDGRYMPLLPFDTLETWNEYQHGTANLGTRNGHAAQLHHHSAQGNDTLKRKFRIWRCDIPRDNYGQYEGFKVDDDAFNTDFYGGQHRGRPLDRMRNPWIYLKLTGNKQNVEVDAQNRANKVTQTISNINSISSNNNYFLHGKDAAFLDEYQTTWNKMKVQVLRNIAEEGEDPIYEEVQGDYNIIVYPYKGAAKYENIGQFNTSNDVGRKTLANMKAVREEHSDIDIGFYIQPSITDKVDREDVVLRISTYDETAPDGITNETYDEVKDSRVEVHDIVLTYYV